MTDRAAMAAAASRIDAENDHKLQYSNWAEREVRRIDARADLVHAGFSIADARPGIVAVNGTHEVALRSKKWRKIGSDKWYRFANADDLKSRIGSDA